MERIACVLLGLFLFSCNLDKTIDVEYWAPSPQWRKDVLFQLIQYTDKLPDGYNEEMRFDSSLNDYYYQRFNANKWVYFFPSDSIYYFQINRKAPSLFDEEVAVGGRFSIDKNGKVEYVIQDYVSPKWKPEVIMTNSEIVFRQLIKSGHVSQWVGNKKWIDYPDSCNHFNSVSRRWEYNCN